MEPPSNRTSVISKASASSCSLQTVLAGPNDQQQYRQEPEVLVTHVAKRSDYITWDEYFMGVARLSAQRSKDPSTQVGACIVNSEKKIVGIGYNGMPTGCSDDQLPWDRTGPFLETKYAYICHAEMNAILNSSKLLKGCSIYVDLFPCNECAKLIIQSGIIRVIYLSDKYADKEAFIASKKLLKMAGVEAVQIKPTRKQIVISLEAPDLAIQDISR